MKLTAIILLSACLVASAKGNTQNISISVKDAPLQTVFKEIQKQTGYTVFYTYELIQKTGKITLSLQNASLQQVLDECLKGTELSYEIIDKTVVIKQKPTSPNEEANLRNEPPPPIDITGKVTDENGNPLSGASVRVKNSSKGTTTNNEGVFTLKGVDDDAVLEISYVGFEGISIPVSNRTSIFTSLKQKPENLGEVLIQKGYYTEKQKYTLGNAVHIGKDVFENSPVQNPMLALQGRVPGIEITQLSGLNGGGIKLRIQGINSIQSGLDPLIVIDGVPYPSKLAFSYLEGFLQDGSPLNYINPDDIESIDVLKDADATAIYGSRAANGAILITTKKGKIGKTKFSINLQQGWGKVTRRADMMNTRQYLDMRYEAYRNSGVALSTQAINSSNYDLKLWDTTRYTDWQKVLIGGTAKYTNINAGISGGSNIMQYFIGGTFNRRTTVFPGDFDDQVGTMHFNINGASNNQRLKLQLSGSYSYDQNHLSITDLTSLAVRLEPNAPSLYNADGTLNWALDAAGRSSWDNPIARFMNASEFNNTTKNLVSNAVINYNILSGLFISSSFGYTSLQSSIYSPVRLEYNRPESRPNSQRIASYSNRDMSSWIIEPQLQYQRNVSKGKLDGLLGTTIQKSNSSSFGVRGFGYPTDLLMKTLLAAQSTQILVSTSLYNRFNALYGRLNYNWNDEFIVNLTARRDGSNKFGDKNKFHNFWSAGGGWIFSENGWIRQHIHWLSFGKLRSSYGTTGNDQIPDFSYLSLYNIVNPTLFYQNGFGLDVQNVSNPHLQWEETRKWQGGIDAGIVSDRVTISITHSRNQSSNQLIGYVLPTLTGFSSITKNLPATIRNVSWEFMLNTVNVKTKDFSWGSSMNLTLPKNKVLSFPGIELTGYASGNYGIIVGQPIGVVKAYRYGGINPSNGRYMPLDNNGNPTLTPNAAKDKTALISSLAKYYGGFLNNFKYKGFQLDFLFQFVRQIGPKDLNFYNGSRYPGQFSAGSSNQPANAINRWQKPGDSSPVARYDMADAGIINLTNSDNWYSYNASYIRLKNVSLSWQLPVKWLNKAKFQNAVLYFRGQNLATITNYTGLDPESRGTTLPPLQLWTLGVKMEL